MKHTPGPWDVHSEFGEPLKVTIDLTPMQKQVIATVGYAGKSSIEVANAALIAAAPDLLEAAKAVLDEVDSPRDECAMLNLKDAVAKARGEA